MRQNAKKIKDKVVSCIQVLYLLTTSQTIVLTEYKRENVRDGQVGEVDVCGVPDAIIQQH